MNIAVTGHRPDKIGGYDRNNQIRIGIRKKLYKLLNNLKPDKAISGMALGVDQDFVEVALELKIPVIAAIPFIGQEKEWITKESKEYYHFLLSKCELQHVVCDGGYAPWKMNVRNKWMVDNSELIIAVWNGSSGGTANCVKYAMSKNKPVIRFNPNSLDLTLL